jgi:hypothetical protein
MNNKKVSNKRGSFSWVMKANCRLGISAIIDAAFLLLS